MKDYDPSSTLIIDPSLVFCSFTGSTADNWGFTATYGPDGSMFGGGIVVFSLVSRFRLVLFKQILEMVMTVRDGEPFDIGIIKLSPNG